jgi:glycosyltransferase involved in cell wall biosynthesis
MERETVREVTVIIPTYNRPEILRQTIRNLLTHLKFDGYIKVLVGNDSDREHTIVYSGRGLELMPREVEIIPGPRQGLGANLNMLLTMAETPVVLQMDDDHWLVELLDITHYYDDLVRPGSRNGWIRLFLGEEKDFYGNQVGYYKFDASNLGPYWYLKPRIRELYIPSNRPHLKRRDFHVMYGKYKEGVRLGNTEEAFCHQFEDKFMKLGPDKQWVTIPMFGLQVNQWKHVGDSWQKEGL